MQNNIFLLIALLAFNSLNSYQVTINQKNISPEKIQATLSFQLSPEELLQKDSLQITATNSDIKITTPTTDSATILKYDQHLKENIHAYENNVNFNFILDNLSVNTEIYATFKINNLPNVQQQFFTIKNSHIKNDTVISNTAVSTHVQTNNITNQESDSVVQKIIKKVNFIISSMQNKFANLFQSTGSLWIKFLLALLLGILLSLTPCLYPMIPITVGILQSSAQKTVWNNFKLALAYTIGISSIFSIFGLVTAIGSSVFGQLQSNAIIILPLIFLLLYLGLAMFGLYEMYIPKWLKPKSTKVQGGSLKSAFLFGMMSGTVASPCLSPGLALILGHVAKTTTVGGLLDYISGLLLLFIFGIGSSLPLLIIGTFSSSANILPKAGTWMVEIKRILGIMLISTALTHSEKFIPIKILIWIKILGLFSAGIYYFRSITKYDTSKIKTIKNFMATLLIVASFVMIKQAVDNLFVNNSVKKYQYKTNWNNKFEDAKTLALNTDKLMLLKFETEHCPACKVLDKQIFKQNLVDEFLAQNYVCVKIDGDDNTNNHLFKSMEIQGFPTIIIFNPKDSNIIKKWIAQVGTPEEFKEILQKIKA